MVTSSNDNLLKLASLMIAEIEGFFISMHVGLKHPVSEFSFESGRNAFFVIYAGNGMPLKAGVLLSSMAEEDRARIAADVETLARLGYAASYRVLDLGSELLANQIGRILLDLFGATLPLSGATGVETAAESVHEIASRPAPALSAQASGDETSLPAAIVAGAMAVDGIVLPKRKRGRPRKEEVLARQMLMAAQAQAESGFEIPIVQHNDESAPRRRGRPRKVDVAGVDQTQTNAVVAAAMESLFGANGSYRPVNGDAPADDAPALEPVETSAPVNGNGHGNGHAATPQVEEVVETDQPEPEENGGSENGFPGMGFNNGLPLTKNQRRELRRRELERIRRESGISS